MSKIDRGRFKATKMEDVKKQGDEFSSFSRVRRKIPKAINLVQGKNNFRVYPFHPDGGGRTFWEPVSMTWLERERVVYENGQKTDKKEIKRMPVFNAAFHANIEWKELKKRTGFDKIGPSGVYGILMRKMLKENFESEEDYKKELQKATHWKNGLRINTEWSMFGDWWTQGNDKKFGELRVSNALKEKINAVNSKYSSGDSVLGEDLLSDPEDGIPLQIVVDKEANDTSQYYVVDFLQTRDPGKKLSFSLKPDPLDDDQLEKLLEFDPLFRIYRDVYCSRDFDLEVEGLSRFDASFGYGIMETDEMIMFLEEFKSLVPDKPASYDDESDRDDSESNKKDSSTTNEEEDSSEISDQEENPFEDEKEDDLDSELDKESKESKDSKKMSAKEKLAALQGKLNK